MKYGRADLMAIAAVRYCLGRMSYIVGDCADWLIAEWGQIEEGARKTIQRDVEEAFARDNDARAMGNEYKPLGMDCDRASWERVRELWGGGENEPRLSNRRKGEGDSMLVTPQETFLELEEAADALGMHPVTLRERAAAGIIPGFKLGKEWRFRTTRIAAYAAEQEARGECFGSIREERKARSGTTSASTVSELENLLGRQIGGKPSASQRKRTSPA